MDFITNLKYRFQSGSMLTRLIMINVAAFVLLRLLGVCAMLFGASWMSSLIDYVMLPSNLGQLLLQPWTLLTYMFCHYDVLHILFNMLWLYWFGTMFMEFHSQRNLLSLYLLGGVGGAALYLLAFATIPALAMHSSMLLGASASIIAIVVVTALRLPHYGVYLIFFGRVELRWIAIVTLAIDFLCLLDGNAGGHIAHLGGAIAGVAYVYCPRIMRSLHAPKAAGAQHAPKSQPKPRREYQNLSEEEIDNILKKIKQSGYASLTDAEKSALFAASKDLQNKK